MKIRKAVIPAAGLGTRFLPVTKSVPKELLPLVDRPLLQYVIAEAAEAGVEEVIIITSPGKESISDYFQPHVALEQRLTDNGAHELLTKVSEATNLARVSFVLQQEALGLGHAVLMAKDVVGDEPFVVILPDDIISHSPGAISQMVKVSEEMEAGVIAVETVPWDVVEDAHRLWCLAGCPASLEDKTSHLRYDLAKRYVAVIVSVTRTRFPGWERQGTWDAFFTTFMQNRWLPLSMLTQ